MKSPVTSPGRLRPPGASMSRLPRSCVRRHGDGFTLLELLVVLAIMALMLSLAVTSFPMRGRAMQTRVAADEVVQALRSARVRAIALNRPVTFSLDVNARSFRVDGSASQPLPATLQLATLTVADRTGQPRNTSNISFAPDGSSSGGRIELAGQDARLLVGVDWLTGRVSVANAR